MPSTCRASARISRRSPQRTCMPQPVLTPSHPRLLIVLAARGRRELERQVLVLLDHRIPSGRIYQTYADALFDAANRRTGEGLAAPDMLEALGAWPVGH